ncbi:hypothetical protein IV203_033534 [Nitzschia inconspicua]|uniref:Uncharacterized protein n=1 Tax=Nitzschia inconspicua TaxID=303405 RepID=A0A9K3M3S8_9STRA|nr:hypothetical protein IV203_023722 [Nitzschia inconspicua]KAG7372810.1 hypothetical protein IV203_033534 [Nitzschia inconspicua]
MDKNNDASTVNTIYTSTNNSKTLNLSVNNSKTLLKHSFVADNGGSVKTFKLLQCSSFIPKDENKHSSIHNSNYRSINNSKTFLKYNVGRGDDTNIIPTCPHP